MSTSVAGRGRPPVYTGNRLSTIVEMVKEHGALKTTNILRADGRQKLADLRDQRVFPKRLSISMPTVLRLAKDAGVQLSRGRRKLPENEPAETVA